MTDPILDPPGAVPALPSEPLVEKLLDAEQTYRQNMRSQAFVASWDSYAYTANLLRDARKAVEAAESQVQALRAWAEHKPWCPMRPRDDGGWERDGTSVLMGTAVHCAGCGKWLGLACVGFGPGAQFPTREPRWPFEETDCPICLLNDEIAKRPFPKAPTDPSRLR